MRNCKLGPDTPRGRDAEFTKAIRQAFDLLFSNPIIAIVLQIVAATRDFKIIFDFRRDSVTFLDPSAEPFARGLFYFSGKIYIGARDLMNKNSAKTVATIIHELTHYCMLLVYQNRANPLKKRTKTENNNLIKLVEAANV